MSRIIFANETRTLMVNVYCNEAVAEIIEAEAEFVKVARRPTEAHTWGPPVRVHLETVER